MQSLQKHQTNCGYKHNGTTHVVKSFIYVLDVSYAPTYIFRSNGYLNYTVTSEDVSWSIRNVKYINERFYNMRCPVMFITAVCLIFLLKLKWPKNKNVYDLVYERYGNETLKVDRNYEKDLSRYTDKISLDIGFLQRCKLFHVFPKFLSFKLMPRSHQSVLKAVFEGVA